MQKLRDLNKMLMPSWVPALLAALGAVIYFLQLIHYSQTQESVLDEGAYLYKGFLFVSGQYSLYQPYGPWSNHMPLAFLIPGVVQVLFGPGILTGRAFAVLLAMFTLLGIWVLARRFGGRWWATGAIWIVVLNTMLSKMYSTGVSQGLVIAMLTWTLVLVLGRERKLWHVVFGALLAGLIFLTRLNMILVLPAVVMYIFWEHGKKAGLLSLAAGGAAVLVGHALYWPDILQLWTKLPRFLTPFLDVWRFPRSYEGTWQPNTSSEGRFLSFFQTIRFHFPVMVGVAASWLLWPARDKWRSKSDFRIAVFLSVLFAALLALHMWYSLGGDYCVFCMPGYLGFFYVVGLLIMIITSSSWTRNKGWFRQLLVVGSILLITSGIGYSAFESIGQVLTELPIPSSLIGSATPGSVPLGGILTNKFGLANRDLRRLLPVLFGFGSGLLLLAISFILYRWAQRRQALLPTSFSYGFLSLVLILATGAILSLTILLSGGYNTYNCSGNVLRTYAAAGRHLDETIPADALVYWKGTLSAVPMLYVDDIRIFPPQINDGYSYLTIGDNLDLIQRYGRWNDELSIRWAKQADYVLIEDRSFFGWLKDLIQEGKYQELSPTPLTVDCRDDSEIRIFKNLAVQR